MLPTKYLKECELNKQICIKKANLIIKLCGFDRDIKLWNC